MHLSRRAEYALLAMVDLALQATEERVQLREIAGRQGIPEKYLEQLLRLLKTSGLIVSTRGSRGGYQLARRATEISLLEVIEAVEGPLITDEDDSAPAAAQAHLIHALWDELVASLRARLAAISVERLAEQYRQQQMTGDNWVI